MTHESIQSILHTLCRHGKKTDLYIVSGVSTCLIPSSLLPNYENATNEPFLDFDVYLLGTCTSFSWKESMGKYTPIVNQRKVFLSFVRFDRT